MKGEWNWNNFLPEEYHVAIPAARRIGIFSLPPDFQKNLHRVNHTMALDDSIASALSEKSPRAELSQNSASPTSAEKLLGESGNESVVDLTGASGSSDESLQFSPFLAKNTPKVVNISTSSEEGSGKGGEGEGS